MLRSITDMAKKADRALNNSSRVIWADLSLHLYPAGEKLYKKLKVRINLSLTQTSDFLTLI